MLQEHHHMPQNGMQRNARFVHFWGDYHLKNPVSRICIFRGTFNFFRMGMQQMGPPPNQRTPMLMSLPAPGKWNNYRDKDSICVSNKFVSLHSHFMYKSSVFFEI